MNEQRSTAGDAAEAGATAEKRNDRMDPKKDRRAAREIRQEAREGAIDALRYAEAAEAPETESETTTAGRYLRGAPLTIPTAASLMRSLRRAQARDEAETGDGSSPQAGAR